MGVLSGSIRFMRPSESSVMTIGAMIAATSPASTTAAAMILSARRRVRKNTARAIATMARSIRVLTHQGHHQSSRSMTSVAWEIVPPVAFWRITLKINQFEA
jgi:uncharacterized protein with beta-barrel porin domain